MVTISDSTLRQNVYECIYDLLAAEIASTSSPIHSSTLVAAYINGTAAPYPQIVLNPVDVDRKEYSFDRTTSTKTIRLLIDVFTIKNKDKDIICDRIQSLLDNASIQGVMLSGITESNAFEGPGDNKIHLKSVAITYIGR